MAAQDMDLVHGDSEIKFTRGQRCDRCDKSSHWFILARRDGDYGESYDVLCQSCYVERHPACKHR